MGSEEELRDLQALIDLELLGAAPSLTRQQVADAAGMPVALADELWRLLGLPQPGPDEAAFTEADVEAVKHTRELILSGILSTDEQSALVRTWGRSFARLAEWQVALLAQVAQERPGDLATEATNLATTVIPRVEALQSYIWRRHLAGAAGRVLNLTGGESQRLAICFVDIVGYTARSRTLAEDELVAWVEKFESTAAGVVLDHGGRVIKTLGDAVLFVADDPVAAAEVALTLTELGADEADGFPQVRAGLAVGDVVPRLGDVFGPTVNIASRLTSIARPNTVVVDEGAAEALAGGYSLQRLRRVSVKGYSRLQAWALRRAAF